ncbi:amino acid aminotransferase [Candidatus Enterovibrio altilux]|uniref:Aminotransferase n=1 Tax=Candidatus Enterovibrio altilux TaxID=1927128 RepID=A0A291BB97_9GAMM|nr:amino acid aminotransferase [Candidatus Enterovibrio luxaltus]ATF10276.1 Aspartate aminotransferase [Candidatus Enterovibrio luxaltus]
MFEKIVAAPDDPILGLTEEFKSDPRVEKINLGVGIYKDESGNTPVLKTVKKAETILLAKETTKSYLSISGTPEYGLAVQKLLFGNEAMVIAEKRVQTAQAPGGTGALRLAAEFIKRQLGDVKVWVSDPTWANHNGIFAAAGLSVAAYDYYNTETKDMDFAGMLEDLKTAEANDVVLLHGCCHNPTGIDLDTAQWQQLAVLCNNKNLLPMFDFAYQGFAFGVEEDAAGLRIFTDSCAELLVASSFSKNFSLYNERVGAFTIVGKTAENTATAFSQIKNIARVIYSNPPAHGAAIVTLILNNTNLRAEWEQEVTNMRVRIQEMRKQFVATLTEEGVDGNFNFIQRQNGMFSFSGLNRKQVGRLKDEFSVYIVSSGRISIAGMMRSNIGTLCKAIAAVSK